MSMGNWALWTDSCSVKLFVKQENGSTALLSRGLPKVHFIYNSESHSPELDMVAHSCDPSAWEVYDCRKSARARD